MCVPVLALRVELAKIIYHSQKQKCDFNSSCLCCLIFWKLKNLSVKMLKISYIIQM